MLLREGQLLAARAALLACSKSDCPSLVRSDCLEWYASNERAIPSVVFTARRGRSDVFDVRVSVGDNELTAALDGRAHELEPGRHRFRAVLVGAAPLELELLISPGEKGRLVSFEFPDEAATDASRVKPGPVDATPPPAVPSHRPVPLPTYLLGGAGVVLGVGGGVLGYLGKNQRDDLARSPADGGCAPYCSTEQAAGPRSKLVAADVMFGLAGAAAIGAIVSYVLRPEVALPTTRASARVHVGVTPHLATLGLEGRF